MQPAAAGGDPGTARSLCQLMRLRTSSGAALLAVAGWWTLAGWNIRVQVVPVVFSAAAAFACIAFAQVYNDIRDVAQDMNNKPHRPLPSRKISMTAAQWLAGALIAIELGTAGSTGFQPFIVCLSCTAISIAYSLWLKNTIVIGNVAVALVSSCTFVLAALVRHQITLPLLLGQLLIFSFILGNEFYKTASDADGDYHFGLRTIATACQPQTVAASIVLCWVALAAVFVASALIGLYGFAVGGAALVLVPAAQAVWASWRAIDSAVSLARAGHRWWLLAWRLGLPTLVLLRWRIA